MRKQIFLVLGLLMAITAFSQPVTITENFDGNNSTYTSYPASAWKTDTNYYVSSKNSIRGVVPNLTGDSIVLVSSVYDLTNYEYILLRFSHICKVSPQDIVRIEYKISAQGWQTVPVSNYMGNASNYQTKGFNAGSYTEWTLNDSLALPTESWWKQEVFDLRLETGFENEVQFRFILKHGNMPGSQIAYGWLLDDISIIASTYPIDCITEDCYEKNAVALSSIDNPVMGSTTGGIPNPIVVTLYNKGMDDLHSATIYWTVNGENLNSVQWSGNVEWSSRKQDTIGYITPTLGANDTLKVWVSQPNGQTDSYTTDDTLEVIIYGCEHHISGIQPVGAEKNISSISDLLTILNTCFVSGDVTIVLDSGLYNETVDLRNMNNVFGNYSLTITSSTGKAEDVVIKPASGQAGILLGKTHNLTLKNITVDGSASNFHVIQFVDTCTNIVISNCNIKASPTSPANTNICPIFKGSNTGTVDNIRITNNLLQGGYAGFSFYGGAATSYGTNVLFDSNLVNAQSWYGIYCYYTDLISCSYNTFFSRESVTANYWYAIYLNASNGPVKGNRIKQKSTAIFYPLGIYITNYHNNFTTSRGLIANNEIMLNTISAAVYNGGIFIDPNSIADIYHNSISMKATAGGVRGIYVSSSAGSYLTIKNNNIAVTAATSYPIYLTATTYLNQMDIDNNNMYAPLYVGYAGANKSTLETWQSEVTTDLHSIIVQPQFIDESSNLKVSNYKDMLCDSVFSVDADIDGKARMNITTMGCYEDIPLSTVNGTLLRLLGFSDTPVAGQSDSLKAIILNNGTTAIHALNLEWSLNGISHTSGGSNYTTSLAKGQSDTIFIGKITYTPGAKNVNVWINSLNNGSIQDTIKKDDTLALSNYVCNGALNGNLIVADTTDYYSISRALDLLTLCGVSSDIVLLLDSGVYQENVDLTDIDNVLGDYSLSITSRTGNAKDVIIRPLSASAIVLNKSNNITLRNISVDANISLSHAIEFAGVCTNVVIRDCELYADSTTTSNQAFVIYRPSGGIMDSIFIIHNLLHGGYHGFNFTGGTSVDYGTNIVFDSNIVCNHYYNATQISYVDFISCSHNTILSRTTNAYSFWYGLSLNYCNGPIIGNRIIQRSNIITYPRAVSLNNYHANITTYGMIANNEIIVSIGVASNTAYAISVGNNTKTDILHNSIHAAGTAAGRAINIANSAGTFLNLKNNNIVMTNASAYPVYLEAITYLSQMNFNSNNYYAPQFRGYLTGIGAITVANTKDWLTFIPTDIASVSVAPVFSDVSTSLALLDAAGLTCKALDSVPYDIHGQIRKGITTMGCYESTLPYTENVMLTQILPLKQGEASGTTDSVKVVVVNTGTSTITEIDFTWSFNSTTKTFNKHVSIPSGETDTIVLDEIIYPSKSFEFWVWIDQLNAGSLTDDYLGDDTTNIFVLICSSPLAGDYVIGAGEDYESVEDAFDYIDHCGVAGDVNLLLSAGIYPQMYLANFGTQMGAYMLTITSKDKDRDSVIFETKTIAIILNNVRNIKFEKITVNAIAGTGGIQFINSSANVVINNCSILLDTVSTLEKIGVHKGTSTGILDSIYITNNYINGGTYGVYLYAGAGSGANQYGLHIVIDSNVVVNSSNTGIYSNCADFADLSGNTVMSRINNSSMFWYGLGINNSNGNITNNHIRQRSAAITQPYGINIQSLNRYNTTAISTIANNEIVLAINNTYSGINAAYSKAKILHNSIYISGTGASRGINITDHTDNLITIKNNNIAMDAVNAYPVYLNSTANLFLYDMDYNNMYAPTYVGYLAGNKASMTAWRQSLLTDQHSVSVRPQFADSSVSLELSDFSALVCPRDTGVVKDINGVSRRNMTIMGAYSNFKAAFDLEIASIICRETEILYSQSVPVEIEITNLSNSHNIDSATFGWSVNGEIQPSCIWVPASPLITGANLEIPVGSFNATDRTNIFDIVVWIEKVNGGRDSIEWNDTTETSIKVLFTGNNLRISSTEQLIADGVFCIDDYIPFKINVENTGTLDYDFAVNSVNFSLRVTNPEPFSLDTVVSTGEIKSGEFAIIELTNIFPIITAGQYDIKVWMDSTSEIVYDDTLLVYYVSGKFGLPIDEDFSNGIPIAFTSTGINSTNKWDTISQGKGIDVVVNPQFGTGMLAFSGSAGSMTTLSTRQMDLSQTIQPALSFWYFHDTIPSEDYTDVRITIDGGTTYETLLSLAKYNSVYGWRQYSMDLPTYAVNQCVILVFEAMEKSRNGDVTQYIDRILITARQDIAVTKVFTSPLSVCSLENKELKVVMTNLSDPVLNYTTNPTTLTLEVKEMGYMYDTLLSSGILGSFASDTITMATGFNFAKGNYTLKAYFSSILDVDRNNDTLVSSIVINPALSVSIQSESTPNCLTGELTVHPSININNTGNMNLSDIDLTIQIDTGDNNPAVYALFRETYTGTILAGNSDIYTFANSYTVPWNAHYDVRATVYLSCDSAMANATHMIPECVDVKDLRIVSIDNPTTGTIDNIGSSIQVMATFNNRSDGDIFNSLPVTYSVTNSQGVQTATSTENINIGLSETVSHSFSNVYTVPNDTVYYITVYIESRDNYRDNDSMTIKRETNNVGVETLAGNGFTLGQNIPNPAKSTTRIDYSIPESGEVIFHVQSASGQLLYSKTIEATSGVNSLEFNTSTLAAGIYIYSIEYKGQRLIKRMSVQK